MIDGTPHDWFQNGHIYEDLGINIIAVNTPQAKEKVEN